MRPGRIELRAFGFLRSWLWKMGGHSLAFFPYALFDDSAWHRQYAIHEKREGLIF
jgi:hypothetical protein